MADFESELFVDLGLEDSSEAEDLPHPIADVEGGDLPAEVVEKLKAAFIAIEDGAVEAGESLASAASVHRERIAKWPDITTLPQSRATCVKWAKGKWPWGGGWKVCVGHKVQWKHMECELFVVAERPEITAEEVRAALRTSAVAVAVAMLTGAAATGGAAFAAAKEAFIVALVAALGIEATVSLDQKCRWSSWS